MINIITCHFSYHTLYWPTASNTTPNHREISTSKAASSMTGNTEASTNKTRPTAIGQIIFILLIGEYLVLGLGVRVMVYDSTFNSISVIYRRGQFYWWWKMK